MCYSAEASFASAAVLIPFGAFCQRAAARGAPRFWPVAIVPSLFGLQQASEGFVWVGLHHGDEAFARAASRVFLFFALSFWPAWFSLAALLVETERRRKIVLAVWAALSTGWFWLLYLPVLADPSRATARIVYHSLHYVYPDAEWLDPRVRWLLRALYVLTGSAPLLYSSARRVLVLPVLLGVVSAGFAVCLYDYAFTSIWCLWAALLSTSFLLSAVPRSAVRKPHAAVSRPCA